MGANRVERLTHAGVHQIDAEQSQLRDPELSQPHLAGYAAADVQNAVAGARLKRFLEKGGECRPTSARAGA